MDRRDLGGMAMPVGQGLIIYFKQVGIPQIEKAGRVNVIVSGMGAECWSNLARSNSMSSACILHPIPCRPSHSSQRKEIKLFFASRGTPF